MNLPRGPRTGLSAALVFLGALAPGFLHTASAQPVAVRGSVANVFTDNVFMTRDRQWDDAVVPSLRLGVDFAGWWTVEYEGTAEIYTNHAELTSHDHALRLVANPAWGPGGRNQFYGALALETLRNRDDYALLNHVGGRLVTLLSLEPAAWFAWKLGLDARYRRFYDDTASDALDLMPRTEARFTLPSRTTLTPRLAYGFRYSPNLAATGGGTGRPDRTDHQVEAGLHASQGLWDRAGLQAGYFYRHVFGTSAVLPYRMSQSQMAFLTTDFLAGGHRAYLKGKQVLPKGFTLAAGIEYRTLRYAGWPALDAAGADRGIDREDRKLMPSASVHWARDFDVVGLDLGVSYLYVRQWSNSHAYDTHANQVVLEVALDY